MGNQNGSAQREKRSNLVQTVIDNLRNRISSGQLSPGDKLPTEAALITELGVSRTVVREAIAALRGDGLVMARQGAGVFLLPPDTSRSLHIAEEEAGKISTIIEILEVRLAIETEAARLAAVRRAPAQQLALQENCAEMRSAIKAGQATTELDRRFHHAVALAANNKRFPEMLSMLGESAIPRSNVKSVEHAEGASRYGLQISDEHQAIADAISEGNAEKSERAMRNHLESSMNRYRRLINS